MAINKIPGTFSLSRTFKYAQTRRTNEVVYIYTDGDNYIFAFGVIDDTDDEITWITISDPAKIGNA